MPQLKKRLLFLGLPVITILLIVYVFKLTFLKSTLDITRGVEMDRLPEGTRLMVIALQKQIAAEDPLRLPFFLMDDKLRIRKLQQKISFGTNASLHLPREIAYIHLFAGNTNDAILQMEKLVASFNLSLDSLTSNNAEPLRFLALAHLRLGEQQNCIANHNSQSCIVPFHREAVHQNKTHAEQAMALLYRLCDADTTDYTSRWLLNVAAMALDQYPDALPSDLLIPLHDDYTDRPDLPFQPFTNIAGNLGLDFNGLAGGVIIDDFNNDGFLDLITSSCGLDHPLTYHENSGKGYFYDKSSQPGLTGLTGGLNLVQADYDNDGLLDFLVLRGAWLGSYPTYPNSLIKNRGRGMFEDVTHASGLLSFHSSQVACWADFNLDGHLDLFVGNEQTDFSDKNPGGNMIELFLNNGNGTFTNVADSVGLILKAIIKGASWIDYNNDGLPDLIISALGSKNKLFKNVCGNPDQKCHFEDVSESAGIHGPIMSFPVMVFDFNNDGWDDIFIGDFDMAFVAGYDKMPSGWSSDASGQFAREMPGLAPATTMPALYLNNQDNTFTNIAGEAGLHKVCFTMGCNFGDLDNDGFLDIYLGTGTPNYESVMPNRMFRNAGGARFEEVTFSGRFGHIQKGHGISFADLDNDGDQDIYAVMGGIFEGDRFPNVLFENPGNAHAWIALKLVGTSSNRSAIGARITVTALYADGSERQFHRTVSSGGSFGANPLLVHVGLGDATLVRSLEVRWPAKKANPQHFTNLPVNHYMVITENDSLPAFESLSRIDFSSVDLSPVHPHVH
ncbi:MAG: hypothetical protein KatS3mg031_0288 [Chitinophagales bacterium]|nr:MAG: hypothetical protein KatS3mg031_0288 [Chitinophagales bacterium]